MTAQTKQAQAEQTLESVLQNPPSFWIDPNGGGRPNAPADLLSWRVEILKGLADRLKGLLDQQVPLRDKLRQQVRYARSRGDELTLADYLKRLASIEPQVAHNEETLAACSSWAGHSPRHLEARVREAEAVVVAVESELSDYNEARAVVVAAMPDAGAAEAIGKALAPADRSMRQKVADAQAAVKVAIEARDGNAEAISVAERKLASLRK